MRPSNILAFIATVSLGESAIAQPVRIAVSANRPAPGSYSVISSDAFPDLAGHISAVAFVSETQIAIGTTEILLYDIEQETIQVAHTVDESIGQVYQLEYCDATKQLLVGGRGSVTALNVDDWTSAWSHRISETAFESFDASMDGSILLVCHDNEVVVLDLATRETVFEMSVDDSIQVIGAISDDGQCIALGNRGRLRVMDLSQPATPILERSFPGSFVEAVGFGEANSQSAVVSVHSNEVVRVTSLENAEQVSEAGFDHGDVTCIKAAHDSEVIAVGYHVIPGDHESGVRFIQCETGDVYPCTYVEDARPFVYDVAFAPDGRACAAATGEYVQIWNVRGEDE